MFPVWKAHCLLLSGVVGTVRVALSAKQKVWLVRMRCAWFNYNAYAREEYMSPRRNFNHGALKAMWLSLPVRISALFTMKVCCCCPHIVWRIVMTSAKKSGGTSTVSRREFIVRPRAWFTATTIMSSSLSHDTGSCQCVRLDLPMRMKIASMADAVACLKHVTSAMSRYMSSSTYTK